LRFLGGTDDYSLKNVSAAEAAAREAGRGVVRHRRVGLGLRVCRERVDDHQRARASVHLDRCEPLADRGHDPARPHAAHRLGPRTRATVTAKPADAEVVGVVFSLRTFMPVTPPARLLDRVVTPPAATPNSVWLDGRRWEIPTPDNADVFVAGSNSPGDVSSCQARWISR
jgi:hypothetical protein